MWSMGITICNLYSSIRSQMPSSPPPAQSLKGVGNMSFFHFRLPSRMLPHPVILSKPQCFCLSHSVPLTRKALWILFSHCLRLNLSLIFSVKCSLVSLAHTVLLLWPSIIFYHIEKNNHFLYFFFFFASAVFTDTHKCFMHIYCWRHVSKWLEGEKNSGWLMKRWFS